MNPCPPRRRPSSNHRCITMSRRRRGSALLIVLSFVLLLTIITLAFLSRALLEKKVGNASANQTRTDVFAAGAVNAIISDFQQEIAAGSGGLPTPTTTSATIYTASYGPAKVTIYTPYASTAKSPPTPLGMVPSRTWPTTSVLSTIESSSSLKAFPLPNLLKCSLTGVNNGAFFYPTTDATHYPNAGAYPPTEMTFSSQDPDDSTATPSLNGRAYTAQRWNEPLLLPKKTATATDVTPDSTYFTVPDWILVQRDGSNPTVWSTALCATPPGVVTASTSQNPVVGRYAYTVYDEGGLLDMNVAGHPTTVSGTVNYPDTLANADLTQLMLPTTTGTEPGFQQPGPGASLLVTSTTNAINALVGWRNYATLGTSGTIPNYTFSASGLANYFQSIQGDASGLLQTANTALSNGTTGLSDRKFSSRQQLIDLLVNDIAQNTTDKASFQNALQYMGTFSRDLNQPSYQPDSTRPRMDNSNGSKTDPANAGDNTGYQDDSTGATTTDGTKDGAINASFLSAFVQSSFTRNDGTTANKGDPLVKKRFALNRLAWLTYLGPSANRNVTGPSSTPGNKDYDIYQLENNYGISQAFLAQGTPANIQAYFGLSWGPDSNDNGRNKWFYNVHNGAGAGKGSIMVIGSKSLTSDSIPANSPHDPDFFELLKAAILAGSKGKTLTYLSSTKVPNTGSALQPWNYQYWADVSLDYQIIQIGANIIAQFQPTNYAPEIVFNSGNTNETVPAGQTSETDPMEIRGVENLPYLYRTRYGSILLRNPGTQLVSPAGSLPTPTASFTDTGVGMGMLVPEIWNPYDSSAPVGSPAPTNFRVVVDSTDPYSILTSSTGTYNSFYVLGFDDDVTKTPLATYRQASNTAAAPFAPTTPGNPDFTFGPNGVGGEIPGGFAGLPLALYGSATATTTSTATMTPTALTFSVPATAAGQALFRDPTVLCEPNMPPNSNLQMAWDPTKLDNSNLNLEKILNSTGASCFSTTSNGFLADTNSPNPLSLATAPPSTTAYVGIFLGLYPIQWTEKIGTSYLIQDSDRMEFLSTPQPWLTYRMQYADPVTAGNWVTYDEKYLQVNTSNDLNTGNPPALIPPATTDDESTSWNSFLDPRTSRFGTPGSATNVLNKGDFFPARTFIDAANLVLATDRPDNDAGYNYELNASGLNFDLNFAPGWQFGTNGDFRWGPFSQNVKTFAVPNSGLRYVSDPLVGTGSGVTFYYADPDGVVRRAMGGYQPSANSAISGSAPCATTGLPMATADPLATAASGSGTPANLANQHYSRPYILHRPFRSVAELGYVFSGTPWKNLDFFNPESGDSALLDVFCINDTDNPNGLVAGKVNLNTQQPPVLWAILAGAYKDDQNPTANYIGQNDTTGSGVADTEVTDLAYDLITNRTTTLPIVKGSTYALPLLTNLRDLVGRWNQTTAAAANTGTGSGDAGIQYFDGQKTSATLYFDGFSNRSEPLRSGQLIGHKRG